MMNISHGSDYDVILEITGDKNDKKTNSFKDLYRTQKINYSRKNSSNRYRNNRRYKNRDRIYAEI